MHFEILVEDQSGKKALDILIPKIVGNEHTFGELNNILNACRPKPEARFCFAIEEGEAWFLGDLPALKAAYPKFKAAVLNSYVNDSVCGTWEKLADAVYPGGALALSGKGWQAVGAEKSKWAEAISPHMDIENNQSPSFCYFYGKMQELAGVS